METGNYILFSRKLCGWEQCDVQRVKELCNVDELCKIVKKYSMIMMNLKQWERENKVEEYEGMYSNFYTLYMRSPEWKENYFSVLKKYDKLKDINYKKILDEISIENNRVEASFASKLLATVDPNCPIIDSCVRFVLGIGDVEGNSIDERKKDAIKKYEWLKDFYANDKYDEFRQECIKIFDAVIKDTGGYKVSDTKKIDFILWWMGKKKIMVGFGMQEEGHLFQF